MASLAHETDDKGIFLHCVSKFTTVDADGKARQMNNFRRQFSACLSEVNREGFVQEYFRGRFIAKEINSLS